MRMTPALRRCFPFTRAAALALALLAPTSLALAGCFLSSAKPASQIEQGQAITTGKEPFDSFFAAVRAAREEALKAEEQAAGARAPLSRSLGLEDSAPAPAAVDAARARATKLRDGGVLLHLQITPEVKLFSEAGRKARMDEADKSLLAAVEESAKGSLAISKQLGEIASRAAELEKRRAALAQEAGAAFTDAKQRRDVELELEAAARVIAEAAERGDAQAARASKFVLDLAMAIETGADAKRAPGGRPGGRPQAGGKAPPRSGGGRPAGTPAQPPPKPPPKPAGGDDFDH